MIRTRERGMSYWPFVICLVLVLIAVFAWYQAEGRADKMVRERDDARAKAANFEKLYDEASGKVGEISSAVSFIDDATQTSDKTKITEAIGAARTGWPDAFTAKFDTTKYTETGGSGQIEEIGQGETVVRYVTGNELAGVATLESLLPHVATGAGRMKKDIELAFGEITKHRAELVANKTKHDESLAVKQTEIDQLTQQIAQNRATAEASDQELREQLESATQQVKQVQGELETERTQAEESLAKLTNELNQKKAEVVRLNDREVPFLSEGPDGEVVTSRHGQVVLNRGKNDQLMPGTIFTVLGRRKGGATYSKGTVKVTVVDEDTATGRVVALNSESDPVVGGDLVQSLTYSPDRKLSFAFLGEFSKMGVGDAMSRMKALGADVHTKVLPTTHYLVVGTPGPGQESLEDSDAYRRAKEYGIRILTEEMLASFTMY